MVGSIPIQEGERVASTKPYKQFVDLLPFCVAKVIYACNHGDMLGIA